MKSNDSEERRCSGSDNNKDTSVTPSVTRQILQKGLPRTGRDRQRSSDDVFITVSIRPLSSLDKNSAAVQDDQQLANTIKLLLQRKGSEWEGHAVSQIYQHGISEEFVDVDLKFHGSSVS